MNRDTVNYLFLYSWYNYGAISGGGGCLWSANVLPFRHILYYRNYTLANMEFVVTHIDRDTLHYSFNGTAATIALGDSLVIRDSCRTYRVDENTNDTLDFMDHYSTVTVSYRMNCAGIGVITPGLFE